MTISIEGARSPCSVSIGGARPPTTENPLYLQPFCTNLYPQRGDHVGRFQEFLFEKLNVSGQNWPDYKNRKEAHGTTNIEAPPEQNYIPPTLFPPISLLPSPPLLLNRFSQQIPRHGRKSSYQSTNEGRKRDHHEGWIR